MPVRVLGALTTNALPMVMFWTEVLLRVPPARVTVPVPNDVPVFAATVPAASTVPPV